ncbi:MAG: hypothetical protein FVQ84_12290 [Planctomycetes bacterium]|nr:hypothetical protein [Planctomycetota bacterium]
MMKKVLSFSVCLVLLIIIGCGEKPEKPTQISADITQAAQAKTSPMQKQQKAGQLPIAFGEGGQIKMLYDRRQRPQSIYLNNKVHLVFNGAGQIGASPKAPTKPMAVTYDPATRKFSEVVTLGPGKKDHHYCPVIWADEDNYLHVLYGCHSTPGTHLISKQPGSLGSSLDDWAPGPQIAPKISYPSMYRIYDKKELIYYRTAGHTSSWTYRITYDKGKTWLGPAKDVTDMDIKGRFEWSSYQCKLPSQDGRFLHVVFIACDDNKSDDPKRYYNPRYKNQVSNEWKYNLYYIKIDLQTHEVTNFDGESMKTPIDINQADAKCRIWDTKWRGAGVPPTIILDENGDPAFLHVLSEETTESHNYYFVRRANEKWKKTPIAPSNHQWNSCHLARDADGTLHAYLIVGDGYLDTGGYMDRYGGGAVEEWISADKGNTWKKQRDLTPDESRYPGWKYNNIQPVTRPDGSFADGMLLFYGWKDKESPEAKAFLLHEDAVHDSTIPMPRDDE